MAKPAKRSATEAFEQGDAPEQKKQEKRKRSKRERRASDAEQLHTEAESREMAAATNKTPPTLYPHPEPTPEASTPHSRKQKQGRKSEHAATQPEDTIDEVNETTTSLPTQPARKPEKDKSTKQKKKKGRKSKAVVQEHDQDARETEPAVKPVQHVHPKKEKLDKRKRKRKHKPHTSKGDELPTAEEPTTEHTADEVGPVADDAVERPDAPSGTTEKKKKKHKRSRAKRQQEQDGEVPPDDSIEPRPEEDDLKDPDSQADSDGEDLDSDADQGAVVTALIPLEDRIEAPPGEKNRSKKPKSKKHDGWSVSLGAGGTFSDQDPILTQDDEHLILFTDSDVRVYSRSTSLLVRKIQPKLKPQDHIVCCALSASIPTQLLVATSSGYISTWDWTQGEQVRRWKSKSGLGRIQSLHTAGRSQRVLAIQGGPRGSHTTVSMLDLERKSHDAGTTSALLNRQGLEFDVRLFENTGVIVSRTRRHLVLGYCPGFGSDESAPSSFYWRELRVPSEIVSFDVRSTTEHRSGSTPRVDVAVGVESGEILLYEDLLFKLIEKEKKKADAEVSARILHWHRRAVNSVKWSQDGNYLISGGSETVLVIWQLDTNQQQHLPHLSSEILNIAVSPNGSSYALRLSDNSVMVLSTANLDVTTNVSGLVAVQDSAAPLAASLHPTSSDRLLLAISRNTFQKDHPAFALQTYDLSTDRELGRQGLTRNSTTVVTTHSSGSSNLEPNVTNLRLSTDGKWLATAEVWCADPRDLDGVNLTSEDDVEEFGAEVCLKFWLYNEQQSEWELVNRIDDPHVRGSIKVLALESSPSRNEFASAGSDGKVKTWRPKARVRDGVPVRNEAGEQLYNWGQTNVISCGVAQPAKTGSRFSSAVLAYSLDGTVIAASWSQQAPTPRWTYLIDSEDGKICYTTPDLLNHGPASLVFSDRYLLSLSESICIYDTVSGTIISKTTLEGGFRGPHRRGYLAANNIDGTVAVAVNPSNAKGAGRLAIIDAKNLAEGPVFEQEVPGQIHALLTSPSVQGYVLIEGNSKIRHVRKTGAKALQAMTTARGEVKESEDVRRGLDRIFGQTQAPLRVLPQLEKTNGVRGDVVMGGVGEEKAQTASKTLEDVLNFPTSASVPSVSGLFERVVGLFRGTAVGA